MHNILEYVLSVLYLCTTFNVLYMKLENNLAITMLFAHTEKDVRFSQVYQHSTFFHSVVFLLKHAIIWAALQHK